MSHRDLTPGYDRVKHFCTEFREPPSAVPAGDVDVSGNGRWRIWQYAGTKTDAPVLGNGDMLSAFAGPCEYPQFWVTANDFWQMESNPNWTFFHDNATAAVDPPVALGSPRPVGRLVFSIPALKGMDYLVRQTFADAVTAATYSSAGEEFRMQSYVAAVENLLVVRMTSGMKTPVDISAEFRFPDETGKGCSEGVDLSGGRDGSGRDLKGTFAGLMGGSPVQVKRCRGGLLSGWREFSEKVDVPVKAGFAGRFLETDMDTAGTEDDAHPHMRLAPGESCTFVFALRTWDKVSRPLEMAASRAAWITKKDLEALFSQHTAWWRDFWNVSGIAIDDELLEQRYYLSQYMMGSMSRDPDYPPNILGVCTFDRPAWNADYKINYNHQSSYLGLLGSGHFAQADPHDAPYFAMADIAREMSRRLLGHEGMYLPLGLGPKGMVAEPLLLHMKSQAVHGSTNMMMRYLISRDREYGKRIYPYLVSVADFWESDLVLRDGCYHVVDDSVHERTDRDVQENGIPEDPVNTLGYLRSFFSFMQTISRELDLDEDRRARWKEIGEHLAPYPAGTLREAAENPTLWAEADVPLSELLPDEWMDANVFYNEGKGGRWSYHFPGNIMQIYPGGAIGLDSDPALLETARNTIHVHALIEDSLAAYKKAHDTGANDIDRDPLAPDDTYLKTSAWNATNLSCLFFPAAVRVGYDPEIIWRELSERILHRGLPNGYINRNPHGIENLSTVPNTLQEMMLQSHEGVIRVFRVWPKKSHPDAAFRDLWAYGGLQVSAKLCGGEVQEVQITSCRNQEITVENPWPGSGAILAGMAGMEEAGRDLGLAERYCLTIQCGETLRLIPAEKKK